LSFNQILVALNRSPLADAVFQRAVSIAQPHSAEINLVYLINEPVVTPSPTPLTTGTGVGAGWSSPLPIDERDGGSRPTWENQLEEAKSWLMRYQQEATQLGIRAQCETNIGEPGFWICKLAEERQSDLIVLGRRGREGFSEAILGSVSNYVLHNAPCSVLVVQGESQSDGGESS
jgi:nucleotide-binding universal stress UspA family protein